MDPITIKSSKSNHKEKYDSLFHTFLRLCEEVVFILEDELIKSKIKINSITFRVKTFESFYDKILRKEITINHFDKISDLSGVRVVCLYRSDLKKIGKIIKKSFQVLSIDTSRIVNETKFGYMADHYIIKIPPKSTGKRYDDLKLSQCEIQVRTILMDAWAMVSHHLDYKKETDIPSNLKKDFNAVSGLLYAADTHFELFKQGIKEVNKKLLESITSDKFDLTQEINLDSIRAYLSWKLPDREKYSISSYSDLVTDLRKVGYSSMEDLNEAIDKTNEIGQALEKEEIGKKFYSDTGYARICAMLYDEKFYGIMKNRYLDKKSRFLQVN